MGAVGRVTGSCHLVQAGDFRILLDCGLIQGRHQDEDLNADPFPFDASRIDAVVLSHAHIDHSGRLPLLVKRGFTGPVFAQTATRALCNIMLRDSGGIHEQDAKRVNRRRAKENLAPLSRCIHPQTRSRRSGNSGQCAITGSLMSHLPYVHGSGMPGIFSVRRLSSCG